MTGQNLEIDCTNQKNKQTEGLSG